MPVVEVARFVSRRFNDLYDTVFPEPEGKVGRTARLIGLDGKAKMSKSLGNCIYLKDAPEDIRSKVMSAVTDPARIRVDDPGHPDICTIFAYQSAFNPDEAQNIEEKCIRGEVGCVACKKNLISVLENLLEPIRERRAEFDRPGLVEEILRVGTDAAIEEGAKTMELVREAMHIDYFKVGNEGL